MSKVAQIQLALGAGNGMTAGARVTTTMITIITTRKRGGSG